MQMDGQTIPQPKMTPLLRNIPDIDSQAPAQSLCRLARIHGPIFRLSFPPGRDLLVVSSHALVAELCDESRFEKKISLPLEYLRAVAGNGLFTAYNDEPEWQTAHRILVPAFGPGSLRSMFDSMLDIAEQMLLKWERYGESKAIDVADSMTRLTLDTIALCGFGYRFNSFYQNEMHPFVKAMSRSLHEAGSRSRRLSLQNRLMILQQRQFESDVRTMHQIADELIAERRRDPRGSGKDLLSLMIEGRDLETGQGLSDKNIQYQMVTFLIAGHETTSGLLSFAVYELLRNPEVLKKAQEEVLGILGGRTPAFEDLARLSYVDQILKETLRLWPTAPVFALSPYADTVLGGKYPMLQRETAYVLLSELHRDPAVWGSDPERFDPERFAPEAFAKLPPHAWKPFGNGMRACIGRPFAMMEATLVLSMILQRFDIRAFDPAYQIKIKETLTVKPENFRIQVRRRPLPAPLPRIPLPSYGQASSRGRRKDDSESLPACVVLYGSNSGSAKNFAQQIAQTCEDLGYPMQLGSMDDYADRIPKSGLLIVVTASYEGQAPDNAKDFLRSLASLPQHALDGLRYMVFGCGNRDWAATYQAVPKEVDRLLEAAGAQRSMERGEADARGDFFGDFEAWYGRFQKQMTADDGGLVEKSDALSIEVLADRRAEFLGLRDFVSAEIIENRELCTASDDFKKSKRHVEIKLPEGMAYESGDHLLVLPRNPIAKVQAALARFALHQESRIVIHATTSQHRFLPSGQSVSAFEILSSYVELSQPASRKSLEILKAAALCPPDKAALERLAQDEVYTQEILGKRCSVLDLLLRFPSCRISLEQFLETLPPMRARQYSISSSPYWKKDHCSLTFSVMQGPAWSGAGDFRGVGSHFLSELIAGSKISVALRPAQNAFHLPEEPATPVIFIGAGSGMAPFRGFIQQRTLLMASGQILGPCLFFYGCHHPDADFLYRDELRSLAAEGVLDLRPSFSQAKQKEYVQARLWRERSDVLDLVDQGAHVYICGDAAGLVPGVRECLLRMKQAISAPDEAEQWLRHLEEEGRLAVDAFA